MITPTQTVTIDGQVHKVSELPKDVVVQIALYDQYRQDYVKATYDLRKAEIVMNYQRQEIEKLVAQAVIPPTEPESE